MKKTLVMIVCILAILLSGLEVARAVGAFVGWTFAWSSGTRTGYTGRYNKVPSTKTYIIPYQFETAKTKIHLTMKNADVSTAVESLSMPLGSNSTFTVKVDALETAKTTTKIDLSTGAWTNCGNSLAAGTGCDVILDLSIWRFPYWALIGKASTEVTVEYNLDKQ